MLTKMPIEHDTHSLQQTTGINFLEFQLYRGWVRCGHYFAVFNAKFEGFLHRSPWKLNENRVCVSVNYMGSKPFPIVFLSPTIGDVYGI